MKYVCIEISKKENLIIENERLNESKGTLSLIRSLTKTAVFILLLIPLMAAALFLTEPFGAINIENAIPVLIVIEVSILCSALIIGFPINMAKDILKKDIIDEIQKEKQKYLSSTNY